MMTRSGRRRGVSFDSLGGEMCGPLAREETGPCSGAVGCTQEGGDVMSKMDLADDRLGGLPESASSL